MLKSLHRETKISPGFFLNNAFERYQRRTNDNRDLLHSFISNLYIADISKPVTFITPKRGECRVSRLLLHVSHTKGPSRF